MTKNRLFNPNSVEKKNAFVRAIKISLTLHQQETIERKRTKKMFFFKIQFECHFTVSTSSCP